MSRDMTQTGTINSRNRRRIMIAATMAVATAVAIPVMSRGMASAATASVLEDCTRGAPALRSCDFRHERFTNGVEAPPMRVSPIIDNCGSTAQIQNTFRYSVSVNRTLTTDKGTVSEVMGSLDVSLAKIGFDVVTGKTRVEGDGRTVTASETMSGRILADHRGFAMFAPLVGEVVGYLDAIYTEPVEGATQHFYPFKGSDEVKVDFPQLLQDSRPDGYMFIRNVPCSEPISPNGNTSDLSKLEDVAKFNQVPRFTDERVEY